MTKDLPEDDDVDDREPWHNSSGVTWPKLFFVAIIVGFLSPLSLHVLGPLLAPDNHRIVGIVILMLLTFLLLGFVFPPRGKNGG